MIEHVPAAIALVGGARVPVAGDGTVLRGVGRRAARCRRSRRARASTATASPIRSRSRAARVAGAAPVRAAPPRRGRDARHRARPGRAAEGRPGAGLRRRAPGCARSGSPPRACSPTATPQGATLHRRAAAEPAGRRRPRRGDGGAGGAGRARRRRCRSSRPTPDRADDRRAAPQTPRSTPHRRPIDAATGQPIDPPRARRRRAARRRRRRSRRPRARRSEPLHQHSTLSRDLSELSTSSRGSPCTIVAGRIDTSADISLQCGPCRTIRGHVKPSMIA